MMSRHFSLSSELSGAIYFESSECASSVICSDQIAEIINIYNQQRSRMPDYYKVRNKYVVNESQCSKLLYAVTATSSDLLRVVSKDRLFDLLEEIHRGRKTSWKRLVVFSCKTDVFRNF